MEMLGCTNERQREKEGKRNDCVAWGIRGHGDAIHYSLSHVSNRITSLVRQNGCIQKPFALSQCFDLDQFGAFVWRLGKQGKQKEAELHLCLL